MAKNSIPFRNEDQHLGSNNIAYPSENDVYSLNKLAEVASHLQNTGSDVNVNYGTVKCDSNTVVDWIIQKRVYLKFFNQKLEFLYPVRIAATPRYNELLENAKSAFKLPDTTIVLNTMARLFRVI